MFGSCKGWHGLILPKTMFAEFSFEEKPLDSYFFCSGKKTYSHRLEIFENRKNIYPGIFGKYTLED